jgi:CDP-glucose 4,6-dehydratase
VEHRQGSLENLALTHRAMASGTRDVEFWGGRSVLVTGASGLLGSWLAGELVARGASVICLTRHLLPTSRLVSAGLVSQVTLVEGQLVDFDLLLRVLDEYQIDSVFHVGALTDVGTANRSPLTTFEANIRGTWNLLEACRQASHAVQRIVVASSDKAYGIHDQLPYTERTSLQGSFPYEVSKACADMLAQTYFQTYRQPLAITRCGNLFGGGDLNFKRLVPGTIRAILQNERPLIRSDGSMVRDYFYVRDAVDAYLHLAERLPDEGVVGQAFNFSSERPLSVLQLVGLLLQLLGRSEVQPEILNEVSQEIPHQYLDCSRARRVLDWAPARSLEAALLETIDWYSDWLSGDRRLREEMSAVG